MEKKRTGFSEFEVKLYDAGPDGKAKIRTLFNFMQSSADSHSKALGTSMELMAERNLTWVYARFYAEINSYPDMYESVKCETWRSGVTEGMVNREFVMTGIGGLELLRGTSSLALIDRGSRKPVEIPDFILQQFDSEKGRALHYPSLKVEIPEKNDYLYTQKTRYEDLDINGHMNNASYAQMFFESGYSVIQDRANLYSIDIMFKGEVFYDDMITCGISSASGDERRLIHKAFNEKREKVSATAVTEWR